MWSTVEGAPSLLYSGLDECVCSTAIWMLCVNCGMGCGLLVGSRHLTENCTSRAPAQSTCPLLCPINISSSAISKNRTHAHHSPGHVTLTSVLSIARLGVGSVNESPAWVTSRHSHLDSIDSPLAWATPQRYRCGHMREHNNYDLLLKRFSILYSPHHNPGKEASSMCKPSRLCSASTY